MEIDELLSVCDGTPDKKHEENTAKDYRLKVARELNKLSTKENFGDSLIAVYFVNLIIDRECDCDKKTPPEYRVYVNGTDDADLKAVVDRRIQEFIDEEKYFFNYNYNQLCTALPEFIRNGLKNNEGEEYWCRLTRKCKTVIKNKDVYEFDIFKFDKSKLEGVMVYNGKRHPFWRALESEWLSDKFNTASRKVICYNELFRRVLDRIDYFLRFYIDDFNTLSRMKYEGEQNVGSILVLKGKVDEIEKNYDLHLKFNKTIKVSSDSYKKIRKLLEITKEELSLLMNEDDEIYAIGKMISNPMCEYYKIQFEGFLKWTVYKNNEKFICFENMIPQIPNQTIGIRDQDMLLLKKTFGITETSKVERILKEAISQRHGTIVVITENADDEAIRLQKSGIVIEPIDVGNNSILVKAITSIDGAIICDINGICYSIGVILDGVASKRVDSSRGARYNSAIRYTKQRKDNGKKTFTVIVSEDGYVNCFSSEE